MVCYCLTTDQGTVRMVEFCGKFTSIARPGLTCLICCVQSASAPLSMRLQSRMETFDEARGFEVYFDVSASQARRL